MRATASRHGLASPRLTEAGGTGSRSSTLRPAAGASDQVPPTPGSSSIELIAPRPRLAETRSYDRGEADRRRRCDSGATPHKAILMPRRPPRCPGLPRGDPRELTCDALLVGSGVSTPTISADRVGAAKLARIRRECALGERAEREIDRHWLAGLWQWLPSGTLNSSLPVALASALASA